jgi:agmatine deiminase
LLRHLGIRRIESPMVLEGGSIAVDGAGLLVTTEQCLLDPSRNPDLDREAIDEELRLRLGTRQTIWLKDGLIEDVDTDGHVDNICAFYEPGKALLQTVSEKSDLNWEGAQENLARLRNAGIEVTELDLLPKIAGEDDGVVVVPYTNFYIANGAVIVPVSGVDPDMDAEALRRIGELYPGREVVGIDGRTLALGGGGIHCITQQVPAA